MDERVYKKMKSIGASSLVFGIVVLVVGIASGIMLIINGSRLLSHKSETLI